MTNPEDILIQQLKNNDPSGYETLVEKYGNRLLKIAYIITCDRQLAEDVLQESFLTLYQNIKNFREESALSTWITRITINKAKNMIRLKAFRRIPVIDEIIVPDPLPLPDESLEVKEKQVTIRKRLASLPLKYRDVLYLYYYEEMKIKEIAEILDLGESGVKSRLKRGREKLKELLEEGGNFYEENQSDE